MLHITITAIISALLSLHVVASNNCSTGGKVGFVRAVLNPKIFVKTTIPTFGMVFVLLFVVSSTFDI